MSAGFPVCRFACKPACWFTGLDVCMLAGLRVCLFAGKPVGCCPDGEGAAGSASEEGSG